MSEVKVNKISPRSGTAFTLGDSGDTFTVPSGAGLTLTDSTLLLPTTIQTDKLDPKSGTALEIGSSGDTITIPSGATITNSGTATGFGGGITGAQGFRTTGNTIVTTGSNTLITNWEATDEPTQGSIGSSVSHSAGTFTIGATGIWLIQAMFGFKMSVTNRYFGASLQWTPDAWSSTEDVTNISGSAYRDSGLYYQMSSVTSELFDVQDTTNYQVRFQGSCEQTNGAEVVGSSASTQSWCSFIRLGDT